MGSTDKQDSKKSTDVLPRTRIAFQNEPSLKNKGEKVLSSSKVTHDEASNTVDLSSPALCSALQLAHEIQTASVKNGKLKSIQDIDLKESYKEKALRKANIPFKEQIFKNLVDLQITDEDIAPGKNVHQKNAVMDFNKNKDPVFELSHHFKPDFSHESAIKVQEKKVIHEQVQYYKGCEIYEQLESIQDVS